MQFRDSRILIRQDATIKCIIAIQSIFLNMSALFSLALDRAFIEL